MPPQTRSWPAAHGYAISAPESQPESQRGAGLPGASAALSAMKSAPHDKKILLNIGIALGMLDQYRQAEWFLLRAKNLWPRDIRAYLYLIEVAQNTKNTVKTKRYLNELLAGFTLKRFHLDQTNCFNDVDLRPASRKLICNAVNAKIMSIAEDMTRGSGTNSL